MENARPNKQKLLLLSNKLKAMAHIDRIYTDKDPSTMSTTMK